MTQYMICKRFLFGVLGLILFGVASCQGGFNGSKAEVKDVVSGWIRRHANDAESYESVEWRIVKTDTSRYDETPKPQNLALHRYRKNNTLGNPVQHVSIFAMSANGEVIHQSSFGSFIQTVRDEAIPKSVAGNIAREIIMLEDLGMKPIGDGSKKGRRLLVKWLTKG